MSICASAPRNFQLWSLRDMSARKCKIRVWQEVINFRRVSLFFLFQKISESWFDPNRLFFFLLHFVRAMEYIILPSKPSGKRINKYFSYNFRIEGVSKWGFPSWKISGQDSSLSHPLFAFFQFIQLIFIHFLFYFFLYTCIK